jgi:hypothetical protein
MKRKKMRSKLFGKIAEMDVMEFDETDRKKWRFLFDKWATLNRELKEYGARGLTFPEGLSEVAFCLLTRSVKKLKTPQGVTASFDTYNLTTKKAQQIKASSVENDLTSFGPNSKWDELYFLDFYNGGNHDGTFNLYLISNDLIYGHKVNRNQTLKMQQEQGKRPRFSLKKRLIIPHRIEPIRKNVRLWEP